MTHLAMVGYGLIVLAAVIGLTPHRTLRRSCWYAAAVCLASLAFLCWFFDLVTR